LWALSLFTFSTLRTFANCFFAANYTWRVRRTFLFIARTLRLYWLKGVCSVQTTAMMFNSNDIILKARLSMQITLRIIGYAITTTHWNPKQTANKVNILLLSQFNKFEPSYWAFNKIEMIWLGLIWDTLKPVYLEHVDKWFLKIYLLK
jgi:hypothetical protein